MRDRFVGRAAELAEFVTRLDDALAGRRALVLVAGEPGIGKSRLVTELCRLAAARGTPAYWGVCTNEEGAPAFWPWRRILRAWLSDVGSAEAAASVGADAAQLARIAPEVGRAELAPPAGSEDRVALFEVATRFLTGVAARAGLVIVLDDLQWADLDSVALLAHLAREAPDGRLLVAVLYRPAELGPRADPVAELDRLPGAVRVGAGRARRAGDRRHAGRPA